MGKRSRSRSPKRRRDRSRSRDRHRHSGQSRHSKNLKGLEEAKKRMRDGLEAASKQSTDMPGCAPRPFTDLSHAEQVSRVREIERIEEGGFQPGQFKSTVDGGRIQKKNQTKDEIAQDKHDKAMFGPAWMNKEIKKEDLHSEVPSLNISYANSGPPLLNKAFLIDQEERNRNWCEILNEKRRQCQNY